MIPTRVAYLPCSSSAAWQACAESERLLLQLSPWQWSWRGCGVLHGSEPPPGLSGWLRTNLCAAAWGGSSGLCSGCKENHWIYINGLVQYCSISSAFPMEILQSCTEPSTWGCHDMEILFTLLAFYEENLWSPLTKGQQGGGLMFSLRLALTSFGPNSWVASESNLWSQDAWFLAIRHRSNEFVTSYGINGGDGRTDVDDNDDSSARNADGLQTEQGLQFCLIFVPWWKPNWFFIINNDEKSVRVTTIIIYYESLVP